MDHMWDVRGRNESRLTSSFLPKPLEEWMYCLPKGEDGLGKRERLGLGTGWGEGGKGRNHGLAFRDEVSSYSYNSGGQAKVWVKRGCG